jgi:magnesium transporter
MFISFRSFNHDFNSPDYLEAVSFYIVIFKDGVLTVRFECVVADYPLLN